MLVIVRWPKACVTTNRPITRKSIGKQSLEPIDRFWLLIEVSCVGSFYMYVRTLSASESSLSI